MFQSLVRARSDISPSFSGCGSSSYPYACENVRFRGSRAFSPLIGSSPVRASVRQGNGSAPSGRPPGGRGPGGSRLRIRGPDDPGHSLAMLPREIVSVVRNFLICPGEGRGKGVSYPTGTASSAGIGTVRSRHERSWERRVCRRGRPAPTEAEPPEMRMRAGHKRSQAATAVRAGRPRTQEHPRGSMDGRPLPTAGVSRPASPPISMHR